MVNNSETGPTSHDPLGRSRAEIGFEVTLAILICLTSILDNSLVVYVVNRNSRLKNVTNMFIQNLAMTDISMATLHFPFWVISIYTGTWIFSEKWCNVSAEIQITLAIASTLNMGLIALNRYIRVVKPALYTKLFPSKRMAQLYCAVVWLVSMLLATPPLYGWGKMAYHPLFAVCTLSYKIQYISYSILVAGVVIGATTIAIFYSYYKMYKTLKESTQNLNAHGLGNGVGWLERHRADIKLLKTSFAVVCFFMMSWGPGSVVVIVESAGCYIPREVFMTACYLMFTSRLVNPIIYAIMNPQFKGAFKRVFSCDRYGNEHMVQSCTGTGTRPFNETRIVEAVSNGIQDSKSNSTKASVVETAV